MSHDNFSISKLLIAEDEPLEIRKIEKVLKDFFPEIRIVGKTDCIGDTIGLIKCTQPDLVILDIYLKDGTSFDVLNSLDVVEFQIIWTTAHEQFAIKAFRISAVDYLLKPYRICELVNAIRKADENIFRLKYSKKMESFAAQFYITHKDQIVLPTAEAFHVVKIQDIIHCMADDNYTHFFLQNGSMIVVSKPLKHYEELLRGLEFCRVHQSHLINLKRMKQFLKCRKSFVIMDNDEKIPVSKSMKSGVIEYLNGI